MVDIEKESEADFFNASENPEMKEKVASMAGTILDSINSNAHEEDPHIVINSLVLIIVYILQQSSDPQDSFTRNGERTCKAIMRNIEERTKVKDKNDTAT